MSRKTSFVVVVLALICGVLVERSSRVEGAFINYLDHRCADINCTGIYCFYLSNPSNRCTTNETQFAWWKCVPPGDGCQENTNWGKIRCQGTWDQGGSCSCDYYQCQEQ